jgi:glycosyltransferase involved in cell wall biosynthesis
MKLLVVSDSPVIQQDGLAVGYAPYVRELDLWMDAVDETVLFSPNKISKTLLAQPLKQQQFKQVSFVKLDFHKPSAIFLSLLSIPVQAVMLFYYMCQADHIHMRSPGNLGLLAGFVQVLLPRKRKSVKYAGNWDPNAAQPFAYNLQKKIFANEKLSKKISVMAYGQWPDQSRNVKSFFTATYSEKDRMNFVPKAMQPPYRAVYVGTMTANKDPEAVLNIIHAVRQSGGDLRLDYYGEGDQKEYIQSRITALQLNECVKVHGNQPKEVVAAAFQQAHFSFLLSQSEGWPKVVAEAMWHGCVPISTAVSCVPWMLNWGDFKMINQADFENKLPRGMIHYNQETSVANIKELIAHPQQFWNMQREAMRFSQQYTMEKFEAAIKGLLYD